MRRVKALCALWAQRDYAPAAVVRDVIMPFRPRARSDLPKGSLTNPDCRESRHLIPDACRAARLQQAPAL